MSPDIDARVEKLEDAHNELSEKFAKYDGRVLVYQITVGALQFIITGVLLWLVFTSISLQQGNAVITNELKHITSAVKSARKVSLYNQDLIKEHLIRGNDDASEHKAN